jgi:RNA polymerase sigma-70 factor, ECF subfamily
LKTIRVPQPKAPGRRKSPANRETFDRLVGPFRPEIKVHCYRMLGSAHEAEDLVQETFVRAWRSLDQLAGLGAIRAWLYRIATNACLTVLARRKDRHRYLPDSQSPASNRLPDGRPEAEAAWLEPYPDLELEGIADDAAGPATRYELGESVRLAFVAAIQQLPPRQRAVLLLSDVLGWSSQEVALLLGGSVASINSALQRARVTVGKGYAQNESASGPLRNEHERALLERYVHAWEQKDLDAFVNLLHKDAVYRMPPWPQWYQGREAVRTFFKLAWQAYGSFQLIPTHANRQAAFAIYTCGKSDDTWRAHSIQVIEFKQDSIASLTKFVPPLGPKLFGSFGLSTVSQRNLLSRER